MTPPYVDNFFWKTMLRAVLLVSSGAILQKGAYFFLNATFARSLESSQVVEAAKTTALALAWASLLHFSSPRYIARLSCSGDLLGAKVSLLTALALISFAGLGGVAFIVFYPTITGNPATLTTLMLAMAIGASLFDLSTSLSNALGFNAPAALAQAGFGLSMALCALGIIWCGPDFAIRITALLAVSSLVCGGILVRVIYSTLWQGEREPLVLSKTLRQFRDLVCFSLPAVLSSFCLMPLVLWTVDSVQGISGPDFVIYLVCQNLLGLAMLIPGQVNTASFSLLARNASSTSVMWRTLAVTVGAAAMSSVCIVLALPFLGIVFGEGLDPVRSSAVWFIAASIPLTLHQFVATRMYIAGKPWLEAFANVAFGLTFVSGSYLIAETHSPIKHAAIMLFLSYCLRLAVFLIICRYARRKLH